jgi:hypothetical protein
VLFDSAFGQTKFSGRDPHRDEDAADAHKERDHAHPPRDLRVVLEQSPPIEQVVPVVSLALLAAQRAGEGDEGSTVRERFLSPVCGGLRGSGLCRALFVPRAQSTAVDPLDWALLIALSSLLFAYIKYPEVFGSRRAVHAGD